MYIVLELIQIHFFVCQVVLPRRSLLVLQGNGADVAKHCIPKVKERRISITLRKMPEWATKATFDARRRKEQASSGGNGGNGGGGGSKRSGGNSSGSGSGGSGGSGRGSGGWKNSSGPSSGKKKERMLTF